MKRLLLVAGVLAFLKWRHDRFDADDREQGFGAYAPVAPAS